MRIRGDLVVVTDNELAFLTIKVQELIRERGGHVTLVAISEGFLSAGNDQAIPGLGVQLPDQEDARQLLELAARLRRLARSL